METRLIFIFLGMALVTYIPRMLPLVGLSKKEIPLLFGQWLRYIPVAVLSALLVPSIILVENDVQINWSNPLLVTAIPSFLVALKTRSLVWTIGTGMVSMLLLQNFA